MALPHEMYPPKPLSPSAKLADGITAASMTITLNMPAGVILPEGPNMLTIGDEGDETAETILYSSVSGNTVTVAERGFDGTTAKSWDAETPVARMVTAYDLESLQKNLKHGFEGDRVEVGKDASATGAYSVAIGRGAVANNDNEAVLGTDSSDETGTSKWKIPGSLEVGEGIKGAEKTFTVNVGATGWTGESAPFSNALFVLGMSVSDNPVVDIVMSGDFETDQALLEAWASVYRVTTSDDVVTLYAIEKPAIDFSIQLKVVR